MKKWLAFMLIFVFAFALYGCGGEKDETVKLTITGDETVKVGESIQLTATFDPASSTKAKQGVTWESLSVSTATVDSTGKVEGLKPGRTVIKAIAKADTSLVAQHFITVEKSGAVSYPDLGGYTIKIAQAGHALGEIDPFNDDYKALDKEAKKEAWSDVEDLFNCTIEVVAYPDYAEWGEPRWTYIESQASSNKADYDFYVVPDSKIGRFVEAEAIVDVSEWYAKYGQNSMDNTYKTSGSYKGNLYSITNGDSGIYNVMYYNVGLLERIGMEEPAKLFNDGEWTFSKFVEYAKEAQTKLDSLGEGYYAVAGNPTYYWVGMSNASGVRLIDVQNWKVGVMDETASKAADALKEIKAANAMTGTSQVDAGVTSWMDNKALFNTGDLWFVNTDNRWKEDLWGEDTRYGYVPFPRADGTSKEDQKIGLAGTATLVMPVDREANYSGFGDECTTENIYYALMTMYLLTEEYYKGDPSYDEEVQLRTLAEKYTETDESIEAFMYMTKSIEEVGFYDPLSSPDNPIVNTGFSDFTRSINKYVYGETAQYSEAVEPYIAQLEEALTKAFS